jgi:hypothetical protein
VTKELRPINRENFPEHLNEAIRQWGDWNATFMTDDPTLAADYANGHVLDGDYVTDAVLLGETSVDLAYDEDHIIIYRIGLNDELHNVTLVYVQRPHPHNTQLLAVEADTYWSTVPAPDDNADQTDECPEHGIQQITGYSSTGGPDPYAVNELACGHNVICMGPGSPNEIVHTRRNMNKEI